MKTNLFATIAAAALILAGCTNDENGTDNGAVRLRLTSGVEVQQTRAFTATQGTSITADEVVSVWVDDAETAPNPTPIYKANQLKATGGNGFEGGTEMFFPESGHKINIYAIHGNFTAPFTADDAFPTAAVEYKVEADQSVGSIAYTHSDLLYAYEKDVARSNSPVQLTFYHLLSKLELAIKVGEGAPKLASTGAVKLGGVTLNGNFTPSTSADMSIQSQRAGMLSAASTTSSSDMTLGQTICTDFTDPNVKYNEAILVPQDMIGKVLTFTLADGGILKYTIPAFDATPGAAVFESGKKYQYQITLKLTGLEVTSKIEDWEAVGVPVPGDAVMD
uniref:fimbrillin family protein n=1 Tax=uncultured Bacteroides sp. TaxID=162156 RepID=UPI0025EA3055|nr:fimbrillin family protein [uncultured Bacteroides sp.]